MTLDNLIGKLQEIRKNHPGDIKVELVSEDVDFDYGAITSVKTADCAETELNYSTGEEEPVVEVAVQIGFTAENYD